MSFDLDIEREIIDAARNNGTDPLRAALAAAKRIPASHKNLGKILDPQDVVEIKDAVRSTVPPQDTPKK